MKIHIDQDTTLGALKVAFTSTWPHLKLVFFTKPHEEHRGTGAKFMISDEKQTVGQTAAGFQGAVDVVMDDKTTVWQLEQLFETQLGLHVHVFRRSGNTWLESTVSDDLTLAQQEAKGLAGEQGGIYIPDLIDYREQD